MKNLPGILFLIATPCSVYLFVKASEATGSDLVGLLAAVGLYLAVAFVLAFFMNRRNSGKGE
ncbi:hypothetical protein [Fibrobacter sp. UBA4309]|jgi:predicted permease|uniref:hypothetical protein n=1 Tax=Fibrobacter sp. UBA4309 TaxID=1946537 RepID=UPI0025C64230|nr:hypothetical protein [Fibrobacter sp. UBA4309]